MAIINYLICNKLLPIFWDKVMNNFFFKNSIKNNYVSVSTSKITVLTINYSLLQRLLNVLR